uniref:Uncharacterized protein n=1 Tax=Vitis vinifera TaxID=29760 RepID=F6I708_VITVI
MKEKERSVDYDERKGKIVRKETDERDFKRKKKVQKKKLKRMESCGGTLHWGIFPPSSFPCRLAFRAAIHSWIRRTESSIFSLTFRAITSSQSRRPEWSFSA